MRFKCTHDVVSSLQRLLCNLHGLYLMYRSAHWTASSATSYSDHQLFQRLYEPIPDEIDTLAERLVDLCGVESVCASSIADGTADVVARMSDDVCMLTCCWNFEQELIDCCECCLALLEQQGQSLGWNDFLGGVVRQHEQHVYLLCQRMR